MKIYRYPVTLYIQQFYVYYCIKEDCLDIFDTMCDVLYEPVPIYKDGKLETFRHKEYHYIGEF